MYNIIIYHFIEGLKNIKKLLLSCMGLLCFMLHISLQMNGNAYREGSSFTEYRQLNGMKNRIL